MLEDARDLCLDLPYNLPPIELMLTKREQILKSIGIDHVNEYKPSMVFIIEGIRNIVDWDKVLRHESTDGSLFHSPSATACALMHTKKSICLMYLNSKLENLESGVPSVYPIKLITGLSMVDMLERLGIARHFKCETKQVLDNVYRCCKENEIIQGISSTSDILNRSISFRILRSNGYDVSPDSYFSAASTLFSPKMSTARIVWTKIGVLLVLMDDFNDVTIFFSAIYNTVNDIAQDAWVFQGRDVSTHLREMWYKLAISMMEEAEWVKHGYIPTLEEYIEIGKITIGLEPITYKRETKQGKINSVSLFMKEYPGTSVENATEWMRQTVNESTQKLLRNLLQPSVLPRESKQLYWNLAKIVHLYYRNSDEITSPTAMLKHIRVIIFYPVS
ncbi:hypothetical protein SUGI_0386970 [Cryptomeria japonica]|nr:hypothetical protein SUGI_0386970 [Cryptomeria japonica]